MSHCGGLYFDERYVYLFERLTTAFDVYHHVPLMTFCHHQATIQPAHQLTRQALMFESRILSCIFFSKGFEYPADRFIVFSLDAANYLTDRFKEYKHHFQSSETRFEPIIVNRYREWLNVNTEWWVLIRVTICRFQRISLWMTFLPFSFTWLFPPHTLLFLLFFRHFVFLRFPFVLFFFLFHSRCYWSIVWSKIGASEIHHHPVRISVNAIEVGTIYATRWIIDLWTRTK